MSGTRAGSILNEKCGRPRNQLVRSVASTSARWPRRIRSASSPVTSSISAVTVASAAADRPARCSAVGGRVEPSAEQLHQRPGRGRMDQQDVGHVLPSERTAELGGVVRVRAQQRHLPPLEAGVQHERVEPVGLGRAGPGRVERRTEQLAGPLPAATGHRLPGRGVQGQPEVVDPAAAPVRPDDLERVLVEHLDAQALQHREHGGQRHRRPGQRTAGSAARRPPDSSRWGSSPSCRMRRRSTRACTGSTASLYPWGSPASCSATHSSASPTASRTQSSQLRMAAASCPPSRPTSGRGADASTCTVKCTSTGPGSPTVTAWSMRHPSSCCSRTRSIAALARVEYRSWGRCTRQEKKRPYGSRRTDSRSRRLWVRVSTSTAVSCSSSAVVQNSSSRGSRPITSSIRWPV